MSPNHHVIVGLGLPAAVQSRLALDPLIGKTTEEEWRIRGGTGERERERERGRAKIKGCIVEDNRENEADNMQ